MKDTKGISLETRLPEDVVNAIVVAEIAKALGGCEAMVSACVVAAINQPYKDRNTYGAPTCTIFEHMVKTEIQKKAEEAFKEWVKANEVVIKTALLAELERDKGKRIKEMVKNLATNISTGYGLRLTASMFEKDRD